MRRRLSRLLHGGGHGRGVLPQEHDERWVEVHLHAALALAAAAAPVIVAVTITVAVA
jgi:hypothetical protein